MRPEQGFKQLEVSTVIFVIHFSSFEVHIGSYLQKWKCHVIIYLKFYLS